jgi:hypothetical protein
MDERGSEYECKVEVIQGSSVGAGRSIEWTESELGASSKANQQKILYPFRVSFNHTTHFPLTRLTVSKGKTTSVNALGGPLSIPPSRHSSPSPSQQQRPSCPTGCCCPTGGPYRRCLIGDCSSCLGFVYLFEADKHETSGLGLRQPVQAGSASVLFPPD